MVAPPTTIFRAGSALGAAARCDETVLKVGEPTRFAVTCPRSGKAAVLDASIIDGDFAYTFEKPLK